MKVNYHRGHWNGRRCANFRVIIATVAPVPEDNYEEFIKLNPGKRMYPMSDAFKGQEIQMVEVMIDGQEPFYISNIDGSGSYKVTEGLGWPNVPHFIMRPDKILSEVPKTYWNKRSFAATAAMCKQVDEYWMQRDPVGYTQHKEQIRSIIETHKQIKQQTTNPVDSGSEQN